MNNEEALDELLIGERDQKEILKDYVETPNQLADLIDKAERLGKSLNSNLISEFSKQFGKKRAEEERVRNQEDREYTKKLGDMSENDTERAVRRLKAEFLESGKEYKNFSSFLADQPLLFEFVMRHPRLGVKWVSEQGKKTKEEGFRAYFLPPSYEVEDQPEKTKASIRQPK